MTMIEDTTTVSAEINEVLSRYGLGSLTGWALDQIKLGRSPEQIIQDMWETPEFQARFPAIVERRDAGLPPISPGEYVEYERRAAQLMREANLPPGFYDESSDFHSLIRQDVGLPELQSRIDDGYLRVAAAAPEVRSVFEAYYGPAGDVALAAYFIDPDRAKPLLIQQAAAATFGGTGARYGIGVAQDQAFRAAQIGIDMGQADQGFAQLNLRRALFEETITEDEDLDVANEGVEAQFGLGGEAARKVGQRSRQRAAAMSGYSGGAANTGTGAKSLGSSERAGTTRR